MASTSKEVKVEVTLNGAGFDTPSECSFEFGEEIPTASLTFPAGMNSRYKALKRDIIRVYVGLDEVNEYPLFTGHLSQDPPERFSTKMDLVGSLNRAVHDKIFINSLNNFDGQTIENAIRTVFNDVSELSWMDVFVEETSPSVQVPKDTRFVKGTSKYDFMKQCREFAVDPIGSTINGYTMFQHGDGFYFRKIPNPDDVTASISLSYGDGLLNFEPGSNSELGFNYARVLGKDGVTGEYQNDHRIDIDGLKEMDILTDDDIPTAGEAYEIARANVLTSLFTKSPLNINSHLLLDAIPNQTVVAITGAPYGLSDNYLIKSKNVTIGQSMFDVQCQVTSPTDIVSNLLTQLLSIDRTTAMT